ncbi:MAG TPA: glycosyltransferase family 2 protein [Bryobacteraceae bacterium]|nr:glycosyltransferase family 2 protein [Bryobacteraceae bacterium]
MAATGIIVVTYNSAAAIGACLEAAQKTGAEIVVVDNASADGTRGEVERRGVRLIANSTNRGFAAAVNQGFRALECPYVLLLNPDVVLTTGLERLREACGRPGAAGAGGMLVDPAGRPQNGFMVRRLPTPAMLTMEALVLNRLWPGNPWNRAYRYIGLDHTVEQRVEQPAGALLMIRRAVWEQLGGFDEHFWPIWFEDVDFCRRALDAGYHFVYVPQVAARHTGGHSIAPLTVEMRRVYWYRSLLSYSVRHFRPAGKRAVCLAVIAGSLLRAPFEAAFGRSFRPLAAYWKVARLAGACLAGGRSCCP